MHQILFLQSVCRLLRLFPPPTSRPEPRGEQAQRLKGLQPDLIRWRGDVTLECLKSLQWRPTGPDYKCINAEMASFVGSEQTCPCPPACEEKSYDATTSSANWVAKKYKVGFHPCYLIQFKEDVFSGESCLPLQCIWEQPWVQLAKGQCVLQQSDGENCNRQERLWSQGL